MKRFNFPGTVPIPYLKRFIHWATDLINASSPATPGLNVPYPDGGKERSDNDVRATSH